MYNSTLTSCGHVFNSDAFSRWLQRSAECPLCRARITNLGTANQSQPSENGNPENTRVPLDLRLGIVVNTNVGAIPAMGLFLAGLWPNATIAENPILAAAQQGNVNAIRVLNNLQMLTDLGLKHSYA